LHADAEVFVEFGADVPPDADVAGLSSAIAAFGVALEIVDLARPPDTPEDVVASNVFHRAVAFGPVSAALGECEAPLVVNGEVRAAAPADTAPAERLVAAVRVLAAADESLAAGDRVITGSVVQVPVGAGDDVAADLGPLGRVRLAIAASVAP